MDQYLILEFSTLAEAESALAAVNAMAEQWWSGQGYLVEDGMLVGKNAASGENQPDACRTETWANIQESPDGTFWFSSLSNDHRFADWRNYAPVGQDMGEEKPMPALWMVSI